MCSAGAGTGGRTRARLVTPETRRIALTAQSNGAGDVEAAARRLVEGIARECGGAARVLVADRETPEVEFG